MLTSGLLQIPCEGGSHPTPSSLWRFVLYCIQKLYIYTHAVQTLGGVWYMIKESSDRKRGENSIQSSIKKCFRFFFLFGVTVMFIRSSSSFLPCEGGHLIQASHPLIGVNFSLRSHTVSLALAYVIPAFHPGVTCFCSNTTAVLPQLEQDTRMSQIITGNYPVWNVIDDYGGTLSVSVVRLCVCELALACVELEVRWIGVSCVLVIQYCTSKCWLSANLPPGVWRLWWLLIKPQSCWLLDV